MDKYIVQDAPKATSKNEGMDKYIVQDASKASTNQSHPLSVVATVIFRINNDPKAWSNGDVAINLETIEGFNMIRAISFITHITANDTRWQTHQNTG